MSRNLFIALQLCCLTVWAVGQEVHKDWRIKPGSMDSFELEVASNQEFSISAPVEVHRLKEQWQEDPLDTVDQEVALSVRQILKTGARDYCHAVGIHCYRLTIDCPAIRGEARDCKKLLGHQYFVKSKDFRLLIDARYNVVLETIPLKMYDKVDANAKFQIVAPQSGNVEICQTPKNSGTERCLEAAWSPGEADFAGQLKLRESEERFRPGKSTVILKGLRTKFHTDFDLNKDVTFGQIPKGKDDARYYFKFDWAAGKNAFPSLRIDSKLTPIVSPIGTTMEFSPVIEVDVAQNVEASANKIKVSGVLSWYKPVEDKRKDYQGFLLNLGPSYETDRDFTAENLLFDIDFRPLFDSLYSPRRQAEDLPDDPDNFGHILEVHFGLETGTSLSDRALKVDGLGELAVPKYNILRLSPNLRLFLETKDVSLDIRTHLRYLVSEENIGQVGLVPPPMGMGLPQRQLQLRAVDGFRPFSKATLAISPFEDKRWAIELQYENGSSPPIFSNLNKVSLGLAYKSNFLR